MNIKSYLLLFVASSLVFSCTTDIDDEIRPASTVEIADFIYRGLNYWSIYKADVPNLANDRFSSESEKKTFLNTFETPEEAFEALTSTRDRFSILRDDYIELENALAGIRRSTGMRFSIFEDPNNSSNLYGVVRYVVNNSPAAAAGIERGMLFNAVNGGLLTTSTDLNAIFGADNFTINLATYDGTDFTATGIDISLDQIALTINPVHTVRTINTPDKTIGYLHYTGFTNEFDPELNAAFAQLQSDGVTELILDLRYNGGGSIETANDLCTMITGQFNGQEFITQVYNEDRNAENQFVRKFNSNISNGDGINSLNLNRVFLITSGNTASASELILSGLDPYIPITQIGTTTRGKFEGSFLLYDAPAPNFRRSEANPNHRYVMLPLAIKSVNANGFTDYFDGFIPDILIEEDPFNLGIQGDESDPLTQAAINAALGRSATRNITIEPSRSLFESDEKDPLYQRMMVDNL
ncbi:MAG: carboxyl-terminal processing protease [Flavobacteriales bacterium]|jgi:C-terminal processing protease CtpA/Prc